MPKKETSAETKDKASDSDSDATATKDNQKNNKTRDKRTPSHPAYSEGGIPAFPRHSFYIEGIALIQK